MRVACQVKIENPGEVVAMIAARPQSRASIDTEAELRKKFGTLPLGKKIATLVAFEAITMSEAFDSALEKPLAFGSKTFDKFVKPRSADAQKK